MLHSNLAAGTPAEYNFYSDITITLTFSDGSIVTATVSPQVFVRNRTEEPFVVAEEWLVGYNRMFKLGLKQDFHNHCFIIDQV